MDDKHITTDILKVYVPSVLLASTTISMLNEKSKRKDIIAALTCAEMHEHFENYRCSAWCARLLDHFASTCIILRRA